MYFKLWALALLGVIGAICAYYEWEWATVLLFAPAIIAGAVSLLTEA